jgi:exonuclease III
MAGVAVYSKQAPVNIIKTGLPTFPGDVSSTRGRFIMFEYPSFYLVAVYVPNSGHSNKPDAIAARKRYDQALRTYVHNLDRVKPVIVVGDLNVAPIDEGKLDRSALF